MLHNVVTLKVGSKVTQGHWEWYHSIDCYHFLLMFCSNFVPKTHRFWDIWLQKCCDLENRVRGPSRSLEMPLFDRAHMNIHVHVHMNIHVHIFTFYSNYGSILCCFWDIQCRKMSWPWNRVYFP